MANKLINCKTCGAEMAANAKACPQCGAKNKKPIYKKWWFWLLVVIIGIVIGTSGSDDSEKADTPEKKAEEAQEVSVTYTHYNVTELFDMLKENAMKAEDTFKGQYVELEGYLGTIDSDGKYIGLGARSGDYSYMFSQVQCYIKSDEQKAQIMEMKKDDALVVRGKIKSVGEVMGYSLDIDSIN